MNNWYGKDRYNKDRNFGGKREESPDDWMRRPSERYDREDYYRNNNPDHYENSLEDNRWHFAGKFEDKNDPTYSYGTRDRDVMPEYPTYPMNKQDFYERHPERQFERQLEQRRRNKPINVQTSYPRDDYSYYGDDGDFSSLSDRHYDQGYSRSQYGNNQSDSGPSYTGRGPKGWKRSDESIKEQVCEALEQHPRIDATEIEVEVKEGVVTLRGNIHDRPAKRLAEDLVDWLPGVSDVHNNLTVDKSFFERAKEFFTGDESRDGETRSRSGKPEKNPRH